MSNLLHFAAIDNAIENQVLETIDDVLDSPYWTEVLDDGFENEREFYDTLSFLQNYFPQDLFELVTSYGEQLQPVTKNIELVREDGWYVTVLSPAQFDTFKQSIARALEARPWIEEIDGARLPKPDTRSRMDKMLGKPIPEPESVRVQLDDVPWVQFPTSTVTGDYYLISSLT